MTFPDDHRIGRLESPSVWKLEFRASKRKHVAISCVEVVGKGEFLEEVMHEFVNSQDRKALVFIHGFNVRFDDAVRRTAQIAFDWNFDGPAILFSWPSRGRVLRYATDEESVRESAVRLADILRALNDTIGAESIIVIAHSMGNRALTDALEVLAKDEPGVQFDKLVLAAPDVHIPRFVRFMEAVSGIAKNLTIYSSVHDRALMASRLLHDHPRLGDTVFVHKGVDTIDASGVQTSDWLGHGYFGDSREVLADIHQLLNNQPIHRRFGLVARQYPGGIAYTFHI